MHFKFLKILPILAFALTLLIWPACLLAESTLLYSEALKLAKETWSERFPVNPINIYESKSNHRLLLTKVQNITVYYYRFEVSFPRLYRRNDGSIAQQPEPARSAEFWLRYQPQLKMADFAFVRDDLLPGTNRQWIE